MRSVCFLILFICQFFTVPLFAQQENVWVFGAHAGLDFNTGTPVAIQTAVNEYESSASVCDASGQLLFYTDGDTVYNKNGQIMTNGNGLTGQLMLTGVGANAVTSTTQGALIVPMPDSTGKYYVFSLSSSSGGATHPGWLYYSVVDMSQNSGLGAVDANRRGILLDTNLTESMTGVEGNQCNVWVIVRSKIGFQFKAFNISASGVDTNPVISGAFLNASITIVDSSLFTGGITVSPNHKKIASVLAYGNNGSSVGYAALELADFNATTGVVSNRIVLDSNDYVYECCFSPDNSKLYTSSTLILQYDITSSNPATIIASQYYVGPSNFSDLKLAPNGYIYFFTGNTELGAIEFPNVTGVACMYNSNAVALLPGTSGGPALPNVVPVINTLTIGIDSVKTACFTDSLALQVADTGITDFIWDNGSKDTKRTVYAPGIYVATYHTPPCTSHIDTFIIDFIKPINSTDTVVCSAPPLLLHGPVANAFYTWQDGSRDSTYKAGSSGLYTAQINKNGCTVTDSQTVTFIDLHQNLGKDIVVCKEDMIQQTLNASVPESATALWNNGSTQSSITVNDTGIYWVRVSDAACIGKDSIASDTVHIDEQVCKCIVSMPNAFTPNGDGKDDIIHPIIDPECAIIYILRIYNRWGKSIYIATNEVQGWDGTLNGIPADIGTYMYTLEYQAGFGQKRQYIKGDITLVR